MKSALDSAEPAGVSDYPANRVIHFDRENRRGQSAARQTPANRFIEFRGAAS